jgi:hypothetical protein
MPSVASEGCGILYKPSTELGREEMESQDDAVGARPA